MSEDLPDALCALNQWVTHDDNKVPTPRITGRLLSYEEARRREGGLGFVFLESDHYAGIDIDAMTPLAQRLLTSAREREAFVQRSLSGRGWHIIGRGSLERAVGKGRLDEGVEAYSKGRYFTMPAEPWTGDPDVSIQDLLDQLERPALERGAMVTIQPDELTELLDAIDPDEYQIWITVGMALKAGGYPWTVWDTWSARSGKYPGADVLRGKWESFKSEGVGTGSLYVLARKAGWSDEESAVRQFDVLPPPREAEEGFWERLAISRADMVAPPPPRRWAWRDWVPYGVVTGLAGPPGVAKSTLGLQLCVHHCLGDALYGDEVGQGGAVFITVEDDADELRRRYQNVCAGLFLGPEDVEGLVLIPAVNVVTDLVTVDRDGQLSATDKLRDLRALIRDRGIGLVVLDLVGDFWSGNEIARQEVSSYVRSYLGRLAVQTGCALVAISHLNKSGQVSGSTAWLGSYRSCMVLERTNGHIELSRVKANYAPPLAEPRVLEWDEGYLREIPTAELEADEESRRSSLAEGLPEGIWLGVDALRGYWGVSRAEAHPIAQALVLEEVLTVRSHGGNTQWKRNTPGNE